MVRSVEPPEKPLESSSEEPWILNPSSSAKTGPEALIEVISGWRNGLDSEEEETIYLEDPELSNKFSAEFESIKELIKFENWQDPNFSLKKSYICALLSALAYHHIPELELKGQDKIKIVPSDAYQRLAMQGHKLDVEKFLNKKELRKAVHVTAYAVIVAVRFENVIFVAIRGTHKLYDYVTDAKFLHEPLVAGRKGIQFHRGFYCSIRECFDPLNEMLQNLDANQAPVYVTGHSLGGAMAAIMHGLWTMDTKVGQPVASDIVTHSCYTFGMPRYGNAEALASLRNPFHIRYSEDIIPKLPLKRLGYASCSTEFVLDGVRIEKKLQDHTTSRGITLSQFFNFLSNHKMELYFTQLKRLKDQD